MTEPRTEPCARYFGSDGTLCATHHGRFAQGWQGPPHCEEEAAAPDPAGLLREAAAELEGQLDEQAVREALKWTDWSGDNDRAYSTFMKRYVAARLSSEEADHD